MTLKDLCDKLLSRDNYLILTHERPDADTIGSAAALAGILRSVGKSAFFACADEIPRTLRFLTGGAAFMPVPKEGDYTVVAVDAAARSLLGKCGDLSDRVFISLDHHTSHVDFAEYDYVDKSAAACSEIVFDIAEIIAELPLSPEISQYLYAALAADTGGFRYSNTTPRSHIIAARLVSFGINSAEICRNLFECKTKESIAAETYAMSHVKLFLDGAVSCVVIPNEAKAEFHFNDGDSYDVINAIRRIEGVRIAIAARQRDNESRYKISMRSSCAVDVSGICAKFGGGGHFGAAGFDVAEEDMADALREVVLMCAESGKLYD
ncbi:MAG: DHH family phosphoesterase [Clostridia bacterium]|nr:DHH family phosphoesterase [Clostridia bacterium]